MALHNLYSKIISLDNLLAAYYEFRRGKRKKEGVAEFEIDLESNIFSLHSQLKNLNYKHASYFCFKICDPKPRIIHKAQVKDRIVHQAVHRVLYPIFERNFVFDSYSSRLKKGTHRAVKRLTYFVKRISKNYKNPCYAVKIDIERFFHSIDHKILLNLLEQKIKCPKTIWLTKEIIESFSVKSGKGLPLGNTTSQLFANIYLEPLDKLVKHQLGEKYYLRFCDDFIILKDKPAFSSFILKTKKFLNKNLLLKVKTDKIEIRKLTWGFDFLGYVVLPYHTALRTKTKRRMFRKIEEKKVLLGQGLSHQIKLEQTLNSYLGLLSHSNSYKLQTILKQSNE